MAQSWWKYGLCIFGGLGVGYAVGVRVTKNKAEKEKEEEIENIRDIYRNTRKAEAPKKKKELTLEKPEIENKTSIQMEKLSEKKKAEEAARIYGKAFEQTEKPGTAPKPPEEEEAVDNTNGNDYIHIVEDFPEDSGYESDSLYYYSDGVLTYAVSGQRIPDEDVPHIVGEEALRMLEQDDCNQLYVMNDLYRINYTVIFVYDQWAEVVKEEPYKAEI